jgi:hypothetical protein
MAMRHLTEEEKSKLIELGVDISGLIMKMCSKAEVKSFSYDINGLINRLEAAKMAIEHVSNDYLKCNT